MSSGTGSSSCGGSTGGSKWLPDGDGVADGGLRLGKYIPVDGGCWNGDIASGDMPPRDVERPREDGPERANGGDATPDIGGEYATTAADGVT